MTSIRLTRPTLEVIKVLLASTSNDPAWGLKICQEAELGSGTVYPILDRLERQGLVAGSVESDPHPGRPARRFYELTGAGRTWASSALAERAARYGRRPGFAGGGT
ncbi:MULTISPECIES: helix-turn-helix transcriptional regulator [unclassified Streptomyces]|uniref:PadR family transcriptional regulator n=1 Tax=unclassified Streptomyces TaxID=2593676 RepID=UPI00332B1284